MYKRHTGQISMLENPEMFGSLSLNPENYWVKLSKLVPWDRFDEKYAENFQSKHGHRACDSRMALGSILIKTHYCSMSDENIAEEISMNPYLQYFLGLQEYRYECPFDASMMTRFRQRVTAEMLAWVNDLIIGRNPDPNPDGNGSNSEESDSSDVSNSDSEIEHPTVEIKEESVPENKGTLILDATCAPQNIRFPTDPSLLNEARIKSEKIIDELHKMGLTDGKKPRMYRIKAKNEYNSFSKNRKKTRKSIRKAIKKQLGYLKRNLDNIEKIEQRHPDSLKRLSSRKQEILAIIKMLYQQQKTMFDNKTHSVENRIVSISQFWIRPIVRGKQGADVEFGAKIEMSIVDGYQRIELLQWDAFNEGITLQASVEAYLKAYGFYPERILCDKIFRTRTNIKFCKEHGICLQGPKLGKPPKDEEEYKRQKKQEWLESGERGEIERNFGVDKRRYGLDCIVAKLKETSEVMIHSVVLYSNLRRKLRLLSETFLGFKCACIFSGECSDFWAA